MCVLHALSCRSRGHLVGVFFFFLLVFSRVCNFCRVGVGGCCCVELYSAVGPMLVSGGETCVFSPSVVSTVMYFVERERERERESCRSLCSAGVCPLYQSSWGTSFFKLVRPLSLSGGNSSSNQGVDARTQAVYCWRMCDAM